MLKFNKNNRMSFRSVLLQSALVLAVLLTPTQKASAAGTLPTITGNHHVVFITDTTARGSETSRAYYDDFVQGVANDAGIGSTIGVTWRALVSVKTGGVDESIADAFTFDPYPVYNMNLVPGLVADQFNSTHPNGLFSATRNGAGIDYNSNNILQGGIVWTGSNADGTIGTGTGLGESEAIYGNASASSRFLWNIGTLSPVFNPWAAEEDLQYDTNYLYAIASFITAAPEPSTYLMLGTTLLFAAVARTKRKKVTAPRA